MKTKFLCYTLLAASLFFTGCGDDDTPNDPVTTSDDDGMTDDGTSDTILADAQDETVGTLTNGDQKTWRISQATLSNSSGTFDISTNYNVVDDEFIFSGTRSSGSVEWRPGNDIKLDATSSQASLLDYYQAPEIGGFSFDPESSTALSGLGGKLTFTVVDENTIMGALNFNNRMTDATIDLTLTTKLASDYASPPSSGLSFSEVGSFEAYAAFAQQGNVGMVGSNPNNSIYLAYRDDCAENNLRSRVIKLDLATGNITEKRTDINDFFTRKLNIVNNELVLTGGLNVYTYDLDIIDDPIVSPHNAGSLSRFSSATQGDNLYIVGGDLDDPADKIRLFDRTTGSLNQVATLPTPKVHAGSEILNDKLYVFSGRTEFFNDDTAETTSYIYDINSGSFTSFDFPVTLFNSYAARNQNLIYIVGDTRDLSTGDVNIWMGVYDTLDGSITEIAHNLDDSDLSSYVHAMTVVDNKIYVAYGDASRFDPDDTCTALQWSIQAATLNE